MAIDSPVVAAFTQGATDTQAAAFSDHQVLVGPFFKDSPFFGKVAKLNRVAALPIDAG